MKLTFKKAFGIEFISTDIALWMSEFGKTKYAFVVNGTPVEVACGRFGGTPQEAWVINLYIPSTRRPFGREVWTLDVAFEIGGEITEELRSRAAHHDVANAVVEPHIQKAYQAVKVFIESYRDTKYVKYRGTEQWTRKQFVLPQITEQEFRTFLFYVLRTESGATFVGSFSNGDILNSEPMEGEFSSALQSTLQGSIPAQRKFIEIAWERLFDEDFSGAVIYAAISIEKAMTRLLRMELTARSVGTKSQIGKVIDDTSNRLLCTVLLGALDIGDSDLRNRLAEVFGVRNNLAHGDRAEATRDEAEYAIQAAESFLTIAEQMSKPGIP
jgi:hypothetical protein